MNEQIINAIETKNLLEFCYDGGNRTVEPHCYGITTAGNEGLRAYQVSGQTTSGKFGWKMFDLKNASAIEILEDNFFSHREGYKRGDKGMRTIYKEL